MPPSKGKKPIELEQKKLILAEGADAYWFCIWAYQGFGSTGIQVLDFGGITELDAYLELIKGLPNYEAVETIVIVRDAEVDANAAVNSIKASLKKAKLPAPVKPYEFAGSSLKVAYIIFPGVIKDDIGRSILPDGTLEDLCLEIVKDDPVFECVNHYIDCLQEKGQSVARSHKAKLHAYLSGKNEFVGLKVGEAARVGAWDWSHPRLEPLKRVIIGM